MILNGIVERMKQTGDWKHFEDFFEERRCECVADLLNKAPNITQADIDKANYEIGIYESCINLDKWTQVKEREGGYKGLLVRLGSLVRRRT